MVDITKRHENQMGNINAANATTGDAGYPSWNSITFWTRDNSIASVEEGDALYHAKLNFLKDHKSEALCGSWRYIGKRGLRDLGDAAVAMVDNPTPLNAIFGNHVLFSGFHDGLPVLCWVQRNRGEEEDYTDWQNGFDKPDNSVRSLHVGVLGHRDAIAHILSGLQEKFQNDKLAVIQWWYQSEHGKTTTATYLDALKTKLEPEYYPDLAEHPHEYLKRYLASDSAVLLMAGPPGTGKTTMLRHLICDFNLEAHVVYDENLMQSDQVFQKFLFGGGDILIIEDADVILSPREGGDNLLMARFLNVSDGLIKLPNKKVVFTTNISDFGKVDQALLRPGRCFDVMKTRELDLSEAQKVASVAGLPTPMAKRTYTLAELFNQKQNPTVRRTGFGS